MNKEFIPTDLANEMIKLGFDDFTMFFGDNHKEYLLWQQAFRWFREKYEIESLIKRHFTGSVDWCYGYEICYLPKEFQNMKRPYGNLKYIESYQEGIGSYYGGWNEYEEAELACLIKLIEIAKNK